jgi:chaperonin GroES
MTIQPTSDNIIIKVDTSDAKKTASGIIIPSTVNQAKPDKGFVVAVGQGRMLNDGKIVKPEVKEGDQIIFNRFSGTEIKAGDDTFLIVKENDVMAIITE